MNFLDTIIGYLEVLWNLLVNMVSSLLMAVQFALYGVSGSVLTLSMMPAFISGCGICVITLAVIKFLLGR